MSRTNFHSEGTAGGTRVGSTRSTAAIAGHPLHPMFISFPIAFLVGALVTDLIYAFWQTTDPFWARASMWLIGAGLVMGALAAILGLTDFLTIRRVRQLRAGWIHAVGNVTVGIITIINLVLRLTMSPTSAVKPWGLILSALAVAVLLVTGWMGGELAYRHKIGVVGETGAPRQGEIHIRQAERGDGRRRALAANNRKGRKRR